MTLFDELVSKFPSQIATRPSGHYAHIITLRETESFSIFRTDGTLNFTSVAIGRQDRTPIERITMFMRKQTTPERLRGRELLIKHRPDLMAQCRYNESPCGQCADCVSYGYAIGESGAEKAKILSDSAYSLTGYVISHQVNTFNAPNETGVMYDHASGSTSNRINSTEYVVPGVLFPSVSTARDVSFHMFAFLLNNLLSTKRYGATTTRTGRMANHVVGIVIANGELMSNLALTQAIYDDLNEQGQWPADDLVDVTLAEAAMQRCLPGLIQQSGVAVEMVLLGNELAQFLGEFDVQVSQQPETLFKALDEDVADYKKRLSPENKKGKGK
jgi:CRISPR-associated protein Csc2